MADECRSDRQFAVGEMVLLKLQPYAQQSTVNRPFPKLAFKFFGPFKVLERIGNAAYKLELQSNSPSVPCFSTETIHALLHSTPVFTELPKVIDLTAQPLSPEAILDRRLVKKGNKAIVQVLVKWLHIPEAAATWDDFPILQAWFPEVVAWGQATPEARGSVKP